MASPCMRRLVALVVLVASMATWSTPSFALRQEAGLESSDTARQLINALDPTGTFRDLFKAAAAGAEEKGVPSAVKRLQQWADHFAGRAFDEQRAFEVPQLSEQGAADRIPGFVKSWAEARGRRELEIVLADEQKAAEQDLRTSLQLIMDAVKAMGDEDLRQRLMDDTRFVFILEPALPNLEETHYVTQVMGVPPKVHHYYGLASPVLYEEGDPASQTHKAVVAVAGTFPYAVNGQPVGSPRSIYLSVARLKRYAQLATSMGYHKVLELVEAYLAHLDEDLEAKVHQPWTLPAELADIDRQAVALWQREQEARRQAWADKDAQRVTETFVSVNLAKAFGPLSQIPEAVAQAAQERLAQAKQAGKIKDYVVLRIGDYLLFDVSHHEGAQSQSVRGLIGHAVTDALVKGWDLVGEVPDIRAAISLAGFGAVDWHDADWRYTERASQPTLRQVIVGGSLKASDGILYELYASPDTTTQQAIEGTHGTFFVVQNTENPARGLGFTLPGGETNKGLFDLLAVGKTSNHAIRAVFMGKGSRAPLDEPAAVAFSLGDLQVVVYGSQAGWEAIGGITGPATAPRIIDGTKRRLSLRPFTLAQAPALTSAALGGEWAGYAPTIIYGSQMFKGEFDQLVDPVEGADFPSQSRLEELRELFARVLLGQGEAQPFLKTEEANRRALAAYQRFQARPSKVTREVERGTLTTGVFKADIGSALGHTEPPKVFMAVARAVLEEARQSGLIKDYLVKRRRHTVDDVTEFRVGDDIELHVVHDRPLGDPAIHGLAWRAFWAAGWVLSDVLGRKPYGLMQDLPNAKDLDAWVEAGMTDRILELMIENLKRLALQDERAISLDEVARVETAFQQEFAVQQAGTRQPKASADKAKFQFSGNVKGSGIGSAEGYITPGAWSILAFDKASPGAFSVPFMKAAERALAAGVYMNLWFEIEKVRPEYDESGKEVVQQPIILNFAELDDRALIQAMLGAVNEFQIKAIRTRDADGVMRLVVVNSTDRLYQVTAGVYAGKDDPVSFLDSRFASFVFQWMQTELFITEGDERGSHWAFVLPVPMDRSSPGKHSIPVAVGLSLTVTQQGAIPPGSVVDVFDHPAYDRIRADADYLNWALIRAVGNFGPRGDAASVEATYPLWQNLARITRPDSPYAVTLPVMAGLEEVVQPTPDVLAVFDPNASVPTLGLNALVIASTPAVAGRQRRLGVPAERLLGVLSGGLEETDYLSQVPGMRHFVRAETSSPDWQQQVVAYVSQFGRRVIPVFDLDTLLSGLEELGLPSAVVEQAARLYEQTQRDLAEMY